MEIRQNLVSPSKYDIKCPYTIRATRIVVHNTANDASAQNEVAYMIRNDNEVSYHIAVDDKEAVQGIPLNRNTWSCGDGTSGKGNMQGINIEICYSKSGGERFNKAERNASKLIAQMLKDRGWGVDRVTKHQDYNGKYCPHRTLDMGWQRFLNMVQAELNALNGTKPQPNGSEEPYHGYVEVVYNGSDGVDIHNKADWGKESVSGTAKKGEVFTVVARKLVEGVYMYKLKSGAWTTSAKEYVKFRKTLHEQAEPKMSARQFALEVWIEGKHGNGDTRRKNAERLGVDYNEVQRLIGLLAEGKNI